MRRTHKPEIKTNKKPTQNDILNQHETTSKKQTKPEPLNLSVGNDFDPLLETENHSQNEDPDDQPVMTFGSSNRKFKGSFKQDQSTEEIERVSMMPGKRRGHTGMMRIDSFGGPPLQAQGQIGEKLRLSTGQRERDSDVEDAKEVYFNRMLDSGVENVGAEYDRENQTVQVLESNFNSLPQDAANFD